jgi:putative membrane protein
VRYRALGYALAGPFLVARAGIWPRRLWVVPLLKIQSVAVERSPFQRWLGLATLAVDTAGTGPLRRAAVVDLAVEDARPLLETLSRAAA